MNQSDLDPDQFPTPVVRFPGDPPTPPPAELSDYEIGQIHAGLLLPNAKSVRSMAREIRKWRGVENPDAL